MPDGADSHSLVLMTPPTPANADKNRRRSQRVMLSLPVTVSGESSNGAFREDTRTIVVNAHGALITLVAKVTQQQILRLRNSSHSEDQTCRVTFVGPVTDGRTQVGLEFTKPAPQFWHIAFPPDDWAPPIELAPAAAKSKP